MLDELAFKDFLSTNAIKTGLIVADKGFTVKSANKVFADNPGLHYLLPLKRDAALIDHSRCTRSRGSLRVASR